MTNFLDLGKVIYSNKNFKKISFNAFLICMTWVISRYIAVGPYIKDSQIIVDSFCLLFFFQTLILYYIFSIIIFPKYLYSKKIFSLVICLLISFILIYWSNYLMFDIMITHSSGLPLGNENELWIEKIYHRLHESGWFGCLTNSFIAYWNYGFSFEIVTFYLCIKAFNDIIEIQKNNLVLERDNLELELNFLKSQINPHFLFNTLNSIYVQTVDVSEIASDMILKLSDLMRYSLYCTNEETVELADEVSYIRNYLDLEQYRHFKGLVDVQLHVKGSLDKLKVAPLLLISLVENAFKHGVHSSRKSSFVHVFVETGENFVKFSVKNSIPQHKLMSNEHRRQKQSAGVGLVNTNKRLTLLYPEFHSLTVNQSDTEYCVVLEITFKNNTER